MKFAVHLSQVGNVEAPGMSPSRPTDIPFEKIFSGKRNVEGGSDAICYYACETKPYRHPKLGLGWKCRWHDRLDYADMSEWFVIFFDEPDLLVQEIKAAEWVKKQNKNKKTKGQKNESAKVH